MLKLMYRKIFIYLVVFQSRTKALRREENKDEVLKSKFCNLNYFSKATMAMQFPAKKNAICPKHSANSRPEKIAISPPHRVALRLPSPRGCTDGRADGGTLTSEP